MQVSSFWIRILNITSVKRNWILNKRYINDYLKTNIYIEFSYLSNENVNQKVFLVVSLYPIIWNFTKTLIYVVKSYFKKIT